MQGPPKDVLGTVALAAEAGPDPLDYVAIAVSVLALALSAAVGFSTSRTARRALELSRKQDARREKRFDLYLHPPVSCRLPGGERWLACQLLISNPSDLPNSVVRAELHLTYSMDDKVMKVKVPSARSAEPARMKQIEPLPMPARIDARGASSGWFVFRVPHGLTADQPVERYDIVLSDVYGLAHSLQMTIFQEIAADEPTENLD